MAENENNIFYCYSYRMFLFLKSLRFYYISEGVNKNTNNKYWTFSKSDVLDMAITTWNDIKNLNNNS